MLKKIFRNNFYIQQLPTGLALKYLVFFRLKSLFKINGTLSYSLFGEDNIIKIYIKQLLKKTGPGFYIDIGCNDPIKMSNTFGLYCEGWRGLNVDINNKLIEQFRTIRHRDISICAAVSDIEKDLVIYEFEHHLGTTVDKELSEKFVKEMNWKIVSQRTVRAQTLNSLIEKHNLQEQEIDFMSVDVEGHDLNVLKSLDLDRYRPKLIIAEALNFNIRKFWENELCIYLEMKGYNFLGYIAETCYFADKKF